MSSDFDIEDEIQDFSLLSDYKRNISNTVILKRGEKDFGPDGTFKQQEGLKNRINSMFNVISGERCISKKVYSKAIWVSDLKLARVERMRGTQFKSLGKCVNNVVWLLPEEVIYLVERGSLECWWENGIPMSLQAVYSVCLEESGGIEQYQVYSYLKRLGYYVFRPIKCKNSRLSFLVSYASEKISPFFLWMKALIRFVYNQIYKSLEIIPYHSPPSLEGNYTYDENKTKDPFSITYYVWKPIPNFRKSKLENPDFRIIVLNSRTTSMPSLKEFLDIFDSVPLINYEKNATAFQRLKNGARHIIFALVDSGVISFIKFMDIGFGNEKIYMKYSKK
ncbi:hypothetical protein MERGE_000395 [Pneumocystis wakefieldiae]|uniref:tRNA-splicing endonuclease subunit Sen54 N-terminal domain-containing protein n=1 Tax=Pneumocystis wakefieldiae TaxID=38082 RepID=A0A899FJL1_9ASCO|nr:hypothetical protein MERGE_000395 [Pneumocystis wakefieldiae]